MPEQTVISNDRVMTAPEGSQSPGPVRHPDAVARMQMYREFIERSEQCATDETSEAVVPRKG